MNKFFGNITLLSALTAFVSGCSSNNNGNYLPEYVGSWELETPVNASMNINVANSSSGTEAQVLVNGEMAAILEILHDGSVTEHIQFTTNDLLSCSPCVVNAFVYRQQEYLGMQTTEEGLRASYVRLTDESDSNSQDGYVYVSEGRMCLSNNLFTMLLRMPDTQNVNPLALYFDNCFVTN